MIRELAGFEKALDSVQATEQSLTDTLSFAPSPSNPQGKTGYASTYLLTLPLESAAGGTTTNGATTNRGTTNGSTAHPAHESTHKAEQIVGMALHFPSYSTWRSCPGIYLEDLFIRPAFRRRGYATLLLQELAKEARRISGGKGRLEWSCLRWNEGALRFYEGLGAKQMEGWVGIRVEGRELEKVTGGRLGRWGGEA